MAIIAQNPNPDNSTRLAALLFSAAARYFTSWTVQNIPGNGRVAMHPDLWLSYRAHDLALPIIAPRIGPMAIALDPQQPAKPRDIVSNYAKPPALTGREIIVMSGNGTVEFADGTTGNLAA